MAFREAKLYSLFDFQRLAENPRLSKLIEQTETRINTPEAFILDDEDINVWAAGDIDSARGGAPEVFSDSDDDED